MQPEDQQQPAVEGNTTPTEPTQQAVNPTDNVEPTNPEPTAEPVSGGVITPMSPETNIAPPPTEQPITPAAPIAPVSAPVAPVATKRRISKKVKLIALAIVVVLLLVGGTAGAYFGVIVPSKPDRIIGDSLSNTVNSDKTKSAKFEGEISCEKGDSCKSFSTAIFKGSAAENKIDLNVQLKTVVTNIGFDVRSVGDKSLYVRVSGLDGLDKLLGSYGGGSSASMTSAYAKVLSQINNQWYIVDESLLKQAGVTSSVPTSGKLSKDDAKKIGDAYKKHQFITVDKKLADEKIHNQDSYHLQARMNKDQLKAFMTEVKNANIADLKIEQKDIDDIDKADFSKYPFDVWVNKSNRMIDQLAATITQDGTTVKARIALYDYNQPVNVEKPQGAKSVLELVSQFAPLYSGGVQGANSENPFSLLGI